MPRPNQLKLDKGEKRIHNKIVLGGIVVLAAMIAWVLILNIASRH